MGFGLKPIPRPTSALVTDIIVNIRTAWENFKKLTDAFEPAFYTSVHSDISALLTLIGTTSATIYVNSVVAITANTTIPSNVSVVVLKGGSFAISTGVTLTVAGSFEAGDFAVFSGLGAVAGLDYVNVLWYGAVPDGAYNGSGVISGTDSGAAIVKAIATITANEAGTVFVPVGFYLSTLPLAIPSEGFILQGGNQDKTRIVYTGTTFQDFLTIGNDADQTLNVKLRDITICGGSFSVGVARWAVAAHWFNSGCEIENVTIREGVGQLRIQEAFLSNLSNIRIESSTPGRSLVSAYVSQAQWEEVHGPDFAPVMIMRANNTQISNVFLSTIGSEISGGVTPYAMLILTGQAVGVQSLGMQSCGTHTRGATTYNAVAQYGKVIGNVADGNGFVGQISGDYVEDCDWSVAGIYSEERSRFDVDGIFWYKGRCDGDLVYNAGAGDINIRNGVIYAAASNNLYHTLGTSGSLSESGDVNFENVAVLSGLRVTDGGLAGGADNVFDTATTSYLLGIADRGDRGNTLDRKTSPKKIRGYTITQGSDGSGAYILATSGWFLREDGKYVSNRHPSSTNAPVFQKIRPTTASKFYRVFIGRGGQPYLVQYDVAQTDPTGNWVSEFATDGAIAITGLTDNARMLTYSGVYLPSGQYMTYGSAVPTTGYWNRDDVIWITSASTSTPAFYRCVTSGAPGTWVAVDDFTAKSLTMIGLTLSGSITFTAAGIGANRIPFLNGSKVLATSSSLAWDGTTATVGSFKSSSTSSNVASGTALAAGGSLNGLLFGSGPSLGVYFGSGAPTITAGKGSLYLRTDGSGTADRAYINTDGGTTWTALATAA